MYGWQNLGRQYQQYLQNKTPDFLSTVCMNPCECSISSGDFVTLNVMHSTYNIAHTVKRIHTLKYR